MTTEDLNKIVELCESANPALYGRVPTFKRSRATTFSYTVYGQRLRLHLDASSLRVVVLLTEGPTARAVQRAEFSDANPAAVAAFVLAVLNGGLQPASKLREDDGRALPYQVVLERGPKGARTWEHDKRWKALRRVHSLCALHGCRHTEDVAGRVFTVHASGWYDKGGK